MKPVLTGLMSMKKMRSGWLALLTAFFVLSGCSAVEPNSEPVDLSFPTKSVSEKTFNFDRYERNRAVAAYQKLKADLLFELVIDREGKVEKIRVVRTRLDGYMTAGFRAYVGQMKFTPATSNDPLPYRTLFYPMSTRTEVESVIPL